MSEEDSLAEVIADDESACRQSRGVLVRFGMECRCSGRGGRESVRWGLVRMIEEAGRHCGHRDILRELLNGSTGDQRSAGGFAAPFRQEVPGALTSD